MSYHPPLRTDVLREVTQHLQSGCESFADLVGKLDGLHPIETVDCLRYVAANEPGLHKPAGRLIRDAARKPRHVRASGSLGCLPIPHALDSEWRFSEPTARRLAARILSTERRSGLIVLLGTPTVFQALLQLGAEKNVVLLDGSETVIRSLKETYPRSLAFRLEEQRIATQSIAARTLVCDPPWYPSEMEDFARYATHLSAPGSRLFFALPPRNARPGAVQQKKAVLNVAKRYGWRVCLEEYAQLDYLTPFFEWNAMKAAGIRNIDPYWRHGDLVEFEKERKHARAQAPANRRRLGPRIGWTGLTLKSTRFRLRDSRNLSSGDPRLKPLVTGDVLPSVSRRTSVWSKVDAWTSGNRVFKCSDPSALAAVVRAMADGTDSVLAVASSIGNTLTESQVRQVRDTEAQVDRITKRERVELEQYDSEIGH